MMEKRLSIGSGSFSGSMTGRLDRMNSDARSASASVAQQSFHGGRSSSYGGSRADMESMAGVSDDMDERPTYAVGTMEANYLEMLKKPVRKLAAGLSEVKHPQHLAAHFDHHQ